MKLTYGGVNILALDVDQAHTWIDKSLPLQPTFINPDYIDLIPGALGLTKTYERPRRNQCLGVLHYPCGAARWMEFNILLSQTQYEAIVNFIPNPQTLVLDSTLNNTSAITIEDVYLLPPKPLARFGTYPGFYLATFVDSRYFWQNQSSPSQNLTSWQQLIFYLALDLGIYLSIPTPSGIYGLPHPLGDLNSQYENSALLLDSALWNVGLTLVRNFTGSYQAMTAFNSYIQGQNNRQKTVLAGGDFTQPLALNGTVNNSIAAILPASIQTAFNSVNAQTNLSINAETNHYPYSRNLGDHTMYDWTDVAKVTMFKNQ